MEIAEIIGKANLEFKFIEENTNNWYHCVYQGIMPCRDTDNDYYFNLYKNWIKNAEHIVNNNNIKGLLSERIEVAKEKITNWRKPTMTKIRGLRPLFLSKEEAKDLLKT